MNTLSNTTAIVSADKLPSDNILKAFETVAVKSIDLNKNRTKLVDLLREASVPWTHLLSPNGGKMSPTTCPSTAYWLSVVGAVTNGFPADIQKIMASPATSLTQAQKDTKKKTRKEIGSIIGKISKLLKAKPEKGPRMTYVGAAKATKQGQDYLDNVRKYEDMEHDVVYHAEVLVTLFKKLGLDVK